MTPARTTSTDFPFYFRIFRARLSLLLVASVGCSGLFAATPAAAEAMRLAREGAAAAEAKDIDTYLAKMEAAAALRPDFPRILVNLAAAQTAAGKTDDAIATLNGLAALGVSSPVEKSEDFVALRKRKDFEAVVKKLAANLHPKGPGEAAFSLRDVTGLIEGIAYRDTTGTFYFGDVNARAVWTRSPNGSLQRFTPEGDELLGVFGLAVDETNGALWAATSAVPGMRGFTADQDGVAALAEIDMQSGALRRSIPVVRRPGDQQSHVLGDLALGPDGSVFLTDSGGPVIWRLPPGGTALEPFLEHPEFLSLQGIAILPSGVGVIADHANGLLRVDLNNRSVRPLESPHNATLIGMDGLTLAPDGSVLAIQNGLRPNRVLRIQLEGDANSIISVTALESGHITMAAPSLGCIGPGGDFFFIGNAGWTRFEGTDGQPSSPRAVPVFKTKLPKPKK